jgi:hypothetical protein
VRQPKSTYPRMRKLRAILRRPKASQRAGQFGARSKAKPHTRRFPWAELWVRTLSRTVGTEARTGPTAVNEQRLRASRKRRRSDRRWFCDRVLNLIYLMHISSTDHTCFARRQDKSLSATSGQPTRRHAAQPLSSIGLKLDRMPINYWRAHEPAGESTCRRSRCSVAAQTD